jgi:hypothetical protein
VCLYYASWWYLEAPITMNSIPPLSDRENPMHISRIYTTNSGVNLQVRVLSILYYYGKVIRSPCTSHGLLLHMHVLPYALASIQIDVTAETQLEAWYAVRISSHVKVWRAEFGFRRPTLLSSLTPTSSPHRHPFNNNHNFRPLCSQQLWRTTTSTTQPSIK